MKRRCLNPVAATLALAFTLPNGGFSQSVKRSDEEVIESLNTNTMIVSVAYACGLPEAQARKASDMIADRLRQQYPNLAERLNRDAIFELIASDIEKIRSTVKQKEGSFFGKPCSEYRMMVERLVKSDGSAITFE
jgi:hypothetical protein